MRRRLFNLLAVLSLVLCVATAALWVRSHFVGDSWIWSDGADRPARVYRMGHRYVLTTLRGRVYLVQDTSWWYPPQLRHVRLPADAPVVLDVVSDRSVLGFQWIAHVGTPPVSSVRMPPFLLYRIIAIPHGFIVLVTALLPLVRLLRAQQHRRRQRRLRAGLCPACGYDLRATPKRCPECGTVTMTGATA